MSFPTDKNRELCEHLDGHSFDWKGGWPVGALLHAPGAVLRRVHDASKLDRLILGMVAATLIFSALYGAILGLFAPGVQTLYAAAKVPLIMLGTAALCTPTFYVFNSILGSHLTFRQSVALVLCLTTFAALILAGFAPISWFFTMSTEGFAFLSLLHIAVFLLALGFGIRLLEAARAYLAYVDTSKPALHSGFLRLWFVIVLFVGLQMAYVLRPLMQPGPFCTGERGLFVEFLGKLFQG